MAPLSSTLLVFSALAAVALVGLFSLLRTRRRFVEQLRFTIDYREQLSLLLEHAGRNTYEWLTLNGTRMQAQMGAEGVLSVRPPHANYIVNNYAVVLNALSELRTYLTDELLSKSNLPRQYHALVDDALLRHQGTLSERLRLNAASLRNPLKWFSLGTQALLALPLLVLSSLGILPQRLVSKIRASYFFGLVSGTVAAIGFVSALVGLVTGWEQFLSILRRTIPSAF